MRNQTYQDLETKEVRNLKLYGWVFIYNPFAKQYWATKRETFSQLYNGGKDVLKSDDIHTLEYLINKTDGDPKKLAKIVK